MDIKIFKPIDESLVNGSAITELPRALYLKTHYVLRFLLASGVSIVEELHADERFPAAILHCSPGFMRLAHFLNSRPDLKVQFTEDLMLLVWYTESKFVSTDTTLNGVLTKFCHDCKEPAERDARYCENWQCVSHQKRKLIDPDYEIPANQ